MQDVSYPIDEQGRGPRARFGIAGILTHAALIAVFGVFLPWWKGIEFINPVINSAYACLGILFAAPAAAQAFEQRPRSMREALAHIGRAVLYGESMALAMLLLGFLTVYASHGFLFPPDLETLAQAIALGIAASLALAAIAAWFTLRLSRGGARGAMRIVFLLLLLLFFFRSGWLPDVAGEAALVSLAVAAVAILRVRSVLAKPR